MAAAYLLTFLKASKIFDGFVKYLYELERSRSLNWGLFP
jgi:hypothetical protein